MKRLLYLSIIFFLTFLFPFYSNAVEVGPNFDGIRLGKNISEIKVKLSPSLISENAQISRSQYEMILEGQIEGAQIFSKNVLGIKENISNVLYYKIDNKTFEHIELYINNEGYVVCIRFLRDSMYRFFGTCNKNELRSIFSKKYNTDIRPNTNVNMTNKAIPHDTYQNHKEKWKIVFDFNNQEKATTCILFRYGIIADIKDESSKDNDLSVAINMSTHNVVPESIANNNLKEHKPNIDNVDSGEIVDKESVNQKKLEESPENFISHISSETKTKLIFVFVAIFLILFMIYGFILWKRNRILCFFTGWIDYLIVFFAIASGPIVLFIFSGSNNESELFIRDIAALAIPSIFIFISMMMTFFTNYKYGSGIPLSLYASIYKLICIFLIILVIICLLAQLNAHNDRQERRRKLLQR